VGAFGSHVDLHVDDGMCCSAVDDAFASPPLAVALAPLASPPLAAALAPLASPPADVELAVAPATWMLMIVGGGMIGGGVIGGGGGDTQRTSAGPAILIPSLPPSDTPMHPSAFATCIA
jgi:hypothetical protein